MENNYDEFRKDIDLSNVQVDAQTFQRKKLELDERYSAKIDTEESFCAKEMELANNYEDQIVRMTKLEAISNDLGARMTRLMTEYNKELAEIEEKYEKKHTRPYYFKWMYIGPVGKYNKIMGGFEYYIMLDEFDKLTVYYDAKYSKLVGELQYIPEEWQELKHEVF